MADTVDTITLVDDPRQIVVHLVGKSDGTGETNVIKVDKSAIAQTTDATGAKIEPVALDVDAIRWNIQGYGAIQLSWDHAADRVIAYLAGGGFEDFIGAGDLRERAISPPLKDPATADSTGDILLSSIGAAANGTYDITLWLRKRAA